MRRLSPFHAAARFGFGGSQRDLKAIGTDPLGWVTSQLDSNASIIINGISDSRAEIVSYLDFARKNRLDRRSKSANLDEFKRRQQQYRETRRKMVIAQLTARFEQAVNTPFPVKERFAQYWSNHFTVSHATKPQLAAVCTAYENEAIRPMLDGYFSDMVVAVAKHPAMLMYLDNFQSVGPDSLIGRRRKLGINENLGREMMELHTVGVDGGYTQKDVRSLAKILTGWTVGSPRLARLGATPGEFAFVSLMHEPGPQTLLGKTYRESNENQGLAALRDLAAHPATAKHIATGLVRHFTADDPDPRDIEKVATVFTRTGGHLPSVHKAVVSLDNAWQPDKRKLKTPYELLISTWRGMNLPMTRPKPIIGVLHNMNNLPFSAPSPAGWPDSAEFWGAPAMVKERVQWGVAVGRRLGNFINAMDAAQYLVDPRRSDYLIDSIRRAESPAQGLALLVASPDFQWR